MLLWREGHFYYELTVTTSITKKSLATEGHIVEHIPSMLKTVNRVKGKREMQGKREKEREGDGRNTM